jgi:S1-C subfamily serine protease
MRYLVVMIALIVTLLLGACATPGRYGAGISVKDEYIGGDRYHISVAGHLYGISVGDVEQIFYRRAKDLMEQHGYSDFKVVDFRSGLEAEAYATLPMAFGVVEGIRSASTGSQEPPSGGESGGGSGSGVFVNSAGTILTNAHVINGCSTITASGPIATTSMQVLRADAQTDLAVLVPEHSLAVEPIRFRFGTPIRAGESVVAIGFPLAGLLAAEPIVTLGNVSALAGLRNDTSFLQISAPVNPGNSGGPLLDDRGQLVGIVTAKLDAVAVAGVTGDIPENVNFALKAAIAEIFLQSAGVQPVYGGRTKKLAPADVADLAKRSTVFIICR